MKTQENILFVDVQTDIQSYRAFAQQMKVAVKYSRQNASDVEKVTGELFNGIAHILKLLAEAEKVHTLGYLGIVEQFMTNLYNVEEAGKCLDDLTKEELIEFIRSCIKARHRYNAIGEGSNAEVKP